MDLFTYHQATRHSYESLRRTVHTLDWANMPDPFRHYEGVPIVDLPADPREDPSGAAFLSRLLYHSAAISATKRAPSGIRYALRVNPSSGNLHPTEFHFATRGLPGWDDGLYHYRPSSHMAELRARGNYIDRLLPGSEAPLVFVLTSIAWREAWKYRSRAYRYCLLDIGHASEALILAARWLNCQATVIVDFDDDAIAAACGLAADEWPLLLIALTGLPAEKRAAPPEEWYGGSPNPLSPEVLDYPLITQMHQCSKEGGAALQNCAQPTDRPVLKDFATIARRRRSALDFRGGGETIALDQYSTLLDQAAGARFIQLYSYVHRVRGLERGLYRGTTLLKTGDQRLMAAALSLGQDLAGNSCVTFSMVADLERAFRDFGNRGYRYVHFEAGAIGQRLYLASEAMGFGSTGIGAFYDDDVHAYLGVKHVIYHFACGYPVEDARLTK